MLGIDTSQSRFNQHSPNVTQCLLTGIPALDLYQQQKAALLATRAWFMDPNKSRTALIVLPTGAGKSGVAALIPYVVNSTRVLVITPSEIITKQLWVDFNGSAQLGLPSFYEERGLITTAQSPFFIETALAQLGTLPNATLVQKFSMVNLVIANAHKFGPHSNIDISTIPPNLFDTVIVDEAHHYPAPTWKKITDHFQLSARRIFLTATPQHRGGPIFDDVKDLDEQELQYQVYGASRQQCVDDGLIRPLDFNEVGNAKDSDQQRMEAVCREVHRILLLHDAEQKDVEHQAMILTFQVEEADTVQALYNTIYPAAAGSKPYAVHHAGTGTSNSFKEFQAGERRVLVVCGKALEGFNRKPVSVCGILRNVAPTSTVLFAQFVGRCVRKTSPNDPVRAVVISHVSHKQRANFDRMDQLAEDGQDPDDD